MKCNAAASAQGNYCSQAKLCPVDCLGRKKNQSVTAQADDSVVSWIIQFGLIQQVFGSVNQFLNQVSNQIEQLAFGSE